MNIALAATLIAMVLPAAASAAAAPLEVMPLRVGESKTITLEANPSTGYEWRLDPDRSGDCVTAEFLGYRDKPATAKRIGAPKLAEFRLTGARAGGCDLLFVYLRPWEDKPPARSRKVSVIVGE